MNETKLKYTTLLTLNHSTIHITSDDYEILRNQARALCQAENITANFSPSDDHTVYVTNSDTKEPLGEIVTYPSQTVNSRKQQKAA